MNNRNFSVLSVVAIVAVLVIVCFYLIPNSPEGCTDIVEVVEISKYSEEDLQRKMVGQARVNINDAWGPPAAVKTQPNIDIYEFEDINYQITLEYDLYGHVIRLERNELIKSQ